jgi:hypothetical protein
MYHSVFINGCSGRTISLYLNKIYQRWSWVLTWALGSLNISCHWLLLGSTYEGIILSNREWKPHCRSYSSVYSWTSMMRLFTNSFATKSLCWTWPWYKACTEKGKGHNIGRDGEHYCSASPSTAYPLSSGASTILLYALSVDTVLNMNYFLVVPASKFWLSIGSRISSWSICFLMFMCSLLGAMIYTQYEYDPIVQGMVFDTIVGSIILLW